MKTYAGLAEDVRGLRLDRAFGGRRRLCDVGDAETLEHIHHDVTFRRPARLIERLIWRAAPKDVDKVLRADTDLRNRVEKRLKDAEHRAMTLLVDRKEGPERLAKELVVGGMLDVDRLRALLASEETASVRGATVSVCPSDPNSATSP